MRKKIFFYLIIIYIFGLILPSAKSDAESTSAQNKLIMASVRKESSYDGTFLKLVFTDAFKRIGKEFVYKFLPPKRAGLMANSGEIDGELARTYSYNTKYSNLVRVEESFRSIRFSGFTTDPDIKLNGWESLVGTDYRVEYTRGAKICEINLRRVVAKEKLSQVNHWSFGLKRLIYGRSDILVELERTVLNALKTDDFKNSGIKMAGLMEEVSIYAFLHKKHKTLEPELSAALKAMKNEGLIEIFDNIASINH